MRLVFVNRFFCPDHSATSQILTDLCFALAASGHEVHVVTSRLRYDDPAARLAPEETESGVKVHRVWTSRFGRGSLFGRAADYLTFYLGALWRLVRLADRETTLVAKTDPPMISVVGAVAARATGARLVNWTQDLFPEVAVAVGMHVMPPVVARVLMAIRDWSFASARLTVVIGDRMGAEVTARGVPPARVAVIHNWADGESIAPLAHASNPLRDAWDLQGKFVVGYSGNLGRVHEFDTILDAAERLRERPDIVFLFIGGGHGMDALKAEVGKRALSSVRFRAYQPRERLARSLGACDAHLVTLRPELEGLVVPSKFYGILAAGRPVLFVGARDGEIQDLIRGAQCGEVFPAGAAGSLAEGIVRLARDPSLARQWGDNGRRLFDQRFSAGLALSRWERCLIDVSRS